MSSNLNVLIRNRDRIIYQGIAKRVSSKNEVGKFDVLPSHANFLTLINSPVTVIEPNGNKLEFPVSRGVFRVEDNNVHIFSGMGGMDSE